MLNREHIVEAFNNKFGVDVDAFDETVIDGFIDLEMLGITDEMMLECIEDEIFANANELTDATLIREHLKNKAKPKKKAKSKKKAPEVDQNNPFGMFEQMITGVVASQSGPVVEELVETRLNKWLDENQSKIQKPIEYIIPDTGETFDEVTHEKFETVCKYVIYNLPVMLVGPAGTGKNHLCKQVADFLKLDFYFANAVTQEHKLTGFIDANGVFHETQFYKAFKNGGLFMFDELDASDPEVLVAFNAALANGYFDFPTGRVDAHEDFRVIAAANTTGNGASYEYVGRNQIDAATLNRFGVIEIGYSETIENSLTADSDLLMFIREFRKACDDFGITHVTSYRDITRCSVLKKAIGLKDALKTGLIRNLERDDINMLVNRFESRVDDWSTAFCEMAKEC